MKIKILPHEYAALYREWFNSSLPVSHFARGMGFPLRRVYIMLNKGRVLHNDIFGNT